MSNEIAFTRDDFSSVPEGEIPNIGQFQYGYNDTGPDNPIMYINGVGNTTYAAVCQYDVTAPQESLFMAAVNSFTNPTE